MTKHKTQGAEAEPTWKLDSDKKFGKSFIGDLNVIFISILNKLDSVNDNITGYRAELCAKIDDTRAVADEALKLSKQNAEQLQMFKFENDELKSENIYLKKPVCHLENYSRRNNLVLRGIREQNGEICEQLVRKFFKDQLKLDDPTITAMKFIRVHRLGKIIPKTRGGMESRPIIVRFYDFHEKQKAWGARKNISDNAVSISENFCGATEFNRRKLYPIYRRATKMEKHQRKVSLVEDSLIIDNVHYSVDSLDSLPEDLHPKNLCEKTDGRCRVFGGLYSEFSVFSNWSKSVFTYKNKKIVNIEQGYMYNKALFNDDLCAAHKLSFMTGPMKIKKIGASLKMNDEAGWNAYKCDLMIELLREKFTQNEDLKTQLLDTAQLKLGETGRDQVFSIGLSLTNPEVLNINKWKRNGNKLGIALEKIRNELRNDM